MWWDDWLDKIVPLSYTRLGYRLRRMAWDGEETAVSLDGRVCLITGANRGIGRAAAAQLARRGATVHMLVRDAVGGERARQAIIGAAGNANVHLHLVDLSDQDAVRRFVAAFRHYQPRLDVLINNAGILAPERRLSPDGVELTFAVNVLAPFLLTESLLPLLRASAPARVITVSSGGMYLGRLHLDDWDWAKRPFDGTRAYAETKRAEVILSQGWAARHPQAESGVAFDALHPGWVDTGGVQQSLPTFYRLTRPLLRTPAQGADTIVWLAARRDLGRAPSGRFWFDRRPRPAHYLGLNRHTPAEKARLWTLCRELAPLPPAG
jgi:NAD(P)-dependent dehydrogenase (short-subunit alcohol dehydrogenase family)